MEEQKTVIVTTALSQEAHAALKSDADSKGMKFGAYIANLLMERVAKLLKAA